MTDYQTKPTLKLAANPGIRLRAKSDLKVKVKAWIEEMIWLSV